MIISTDRVGSALGVHLQKTYKTNPVTIPKPAGGLDEASISRFSALIERARAQALSLSDVRANRVDEVRAALKVGQTPQAVDVASSIINQAVEGKE